LKSSGEWRVMSDQKKKSVTSDDYQAKAKAKGGNAGTARSFAAAQDDSEWAGSCPRLFNDPMDR